MHFHADGSERTKSDRRGDLFCLGNVKPIVDDDGLRISGSRDVDCRESWKAEWAVMYSNSDVEWRFKSPASITSVANVVFPAPSRNSSGFVRRE